MRAHHVGDERQSGRLGRQVEHERTALDRVDRGADVDGARRGAAARPAVGLFVCVVEVRGEDCGGVGRWWPERSERDVRVKKAGVLLQARGSLEGEAEAPSERWRLGRERTASLASRRVGADQQRQIARARWRRLNNRAPQPHPPHPQHKTCTHASCNHPSTAKLLAHLQRLEGRQVVGARLEEHADVAGDERLGVEQAVLAHQRDDRLGDLVLLLSVSKVAAADREARVRLGCGRGAICGLAPTRRAAAAAGVRGSKAGQQHPAASSRTSDDAMLASPGVSLGSSSASGLRRIASTTRSTVAASEPEPRSAAAAVAAAGALLAEGSDDADASCVWRQRRAAEVPLIQREPVARPEASWLNWPRPAEEARAPGACISTLHSSAPPESV